MNSACVISGAVLGIAVALFVVCFVGDWMVQITDHPDDDGYLSNFSLHMNVVLELGAIAGLILGGIAGVRATRHPLIATVMIISASMIVLRFVATVIQLSRDELDLSGG